MFFFSRSAAKKWPGRGPHALLVRKDPTGRLLETVYSTSPVDVAAAPLAPQHRRTCAFFWAKVTDHFDGTCLDAGVLFATLTALTVSFLASART